MPVVRQVARACNETLDQRAKGSIPQVTIKAGGRGIGISTGDSFSAWKSD